MNTEPETAQLTASVAAAPSVTSTAASAAATGASPSGKPRLLLVGDAASPTGYARLVEEIFTQLKDKYEIQQHALNYHGKPHSVPWQLHPASSPGSDPYGVARLAPLAAQFKPDLVWMVSDVWILSRYAAALAPLAQGFKTVAYIPVESGPIDPVSASSLAGVDVWAAFTAFGADCLRTAAVKTGKAALANREILSIPLGVDTANFRPPASGDVLDRKAAKQTLFKALPALHDSFIVLNANRNQPRKRIDITMKGFALFAKDKPPNVKLYLHMGTEDLGWNVNLMGQRLGIADRMILSHDKNKPPALGNDKLNLIYNACDVGLNTATCEGWGLIAFEHAATGAPQVMPRHTSLTGLWQHAAELVEPHYVLTNEKTLHDTYFVRPEDVAAALGRIYHHPGYRRALAQAALQNAQQPAYRWDAIAARWDGVLQGLLKPPTT